MVTPLVWLNANLSPIDYKSTSINNTIIDKVYDISSNHYDATPYSTSIIYLEEYEGIKAFSFKSQSSHLKGLTFPALGNVDFSMAVTFASQDLAPTSSVSSAFAIGDQTLTSITIGSAGTGTSQFGSAISFSLPSVSTTENILHKWNAAILTYQAATSNLVIYFNNINTFASAVRVITLSQYYSLNHLGNFEVLGNGSAKCYINEAMIFNSKLSDDSITNLFQYFQKSLSCSTAGYNKHCVRNPVYNRVL
jgi:hypothetical protein